MSSKSFAADTKQYEEVTCKTPLSSLNLEYFSLVHIIGKHNDRSITYLEKWISFMFSHFTNIRDFVNFTQTIYDAKFDLDELECFQRAVTLYLMVYYSSDLQKMTTLEPFLEILQQDLEQINKFVLKDFQKVFENDNFQLIKKLFNEDQLSIPVNIKPYPLIDLPPKYAESTEKEYVKKLKKDIRRVFYENTVDDFKRRYYMLSNMDTYAASVIIDFNWLFNMSFLSLYSKTDLSYVNFAIFEKERKKKLGLRIRSNKFNLTIPEAQSTDLTFFNENELFHVDDMVESFFSMLKYKMVKGNDALIEDIKRVREKKDFSLKNLKGLRKFKYFFKKKNLKSIIEMNLELVSTELRFLTEDFVKMFEKSAHALVKSKDSFICHSYLKLRGINV